MANADELVKNRLNGGSRRPPIASRLCCLALMTVFLPVAPCLAQTDTGKPAVVSTVNAGHEQATEHLGHFSYVQGAVKFRADSSSQWSDATVNIPLREGAQITADSDARAEIRFDDGTTLRITDGAVFTLKSLYNDVDGGFTELSMTDGTATLHVSDPDSVYQIDTPDGDVSVQGPARIRLDAASYLMVGVQQGKATLTNLNGETKLKQGDFAQIQPDQKSPKIEDLPASDDWDSFCDSRDADLTATDAHLPADIAQDAGNLDAAGTWQSDPDYGNVWYPANESADWQPYAEGNWVWFEPAGWTWVSFESWGWAPYHFGSWVHRQRGWGWVPGPKHQRWSPAKVWFLKVGGAVIWTPLSPSEVRMGPTQIAFLYRKNPLSRQVLDGATGTSIAGFQAGTGFHPVRRSGTALASSKPTLGGPAGIRPTPNASSPTRVLGENRFYATTLDRAVYVSHVKAADTLGSASTAPTRATASWTSRAAVPSAGAATRERAEWNPPSHSSPAPLRIIGSPVNRPVAPTPSDAETTVRETREAENGGYTGSTNYAARMHETGPTETGPGEGPREESVNRGWSHHGGTASQHLGEWHSRIESTEPFRPNLLEHQPMRQTQRMQPAHGQMPGGVHPAPGAQSPGNGMGRH